MTSSSTIEAAERDTRGSDFARLSRRISEAGLLERRPGYYTLRLSLVGGLFAAGWILFAAVGDSWYQIPVAVLLALAFAQLALVAHDLAHRQVFRSRRTSEIAGWIAGNLGIGMSYGWWMDKHTRHHANPNHEDHDPDVSPNVIVWSTGQASVAKGFARLIGRYQAFLFFPLLTLEGLNLHASSFRALRRPSLKHRGLEGTLLVAHFVLYFAAVFAVLPLGKGLVFIALHQAIFGVYLGCTFAPNHKGMPMLTGDDRPDFLRRQVLTSRDVRGGMVVDIALGGLNYQIEHHLFPSMPTPNLRLAQPIVRDYCAELDIPYLECGLYDSYAQALRHMHAASAPLRAPKAAAEQ
ncbi:fatty acid desaturase family protein [Sphaerisporangium corydalis]|uniref:Fatty acid desaturase family protein n=1 Tax=Sphaerisporangium corydalis TaxID=1441875 RepID=A0ABV9EE46_9ACTN|nr:acyl-CoA desaturase [Sphaerisporangium corydalis]